MAIIHKVSLYPLFPDRNEFGDVFFWVSVEERTSENPRERSENQPPTSTFSVESGDLTWATLAGGQFMPPPYINMYLDGNCPTI